MVVLYGIRTEHITSWLEQVQHRAAGFVTRTDTEKEGCVTKALKQLNWPTLEKRRQVARLTLMYIKDAIDILCYLHHQSSLKTRASHTLKFIPLQPSRDTYKYSFWPRTIIDWNSLPSDYLTMDSTAKFKATVSVYIFSVYVYPLWFIVFPVPVCLVTNKWRVQNIPCSAPLDTLELSNQIFVQVVAGYE